MICDVVTSWRTKLCRVWHRWQIERRCRVVAIKTSIINLGRSSGSTSSITCNNHSLSTRVWSLQVGNAITNTTAAARLPLPAASRISKGRVTLFVVLLTRIQCIMDFMKISLVGSRQSYCNNNNQPYFFQVFGQPRTFGLQAHHCCYMASAGLDVEWYNFQI